MFFLKNHAENVVGKLVPDPHIKNKKWTYLWNNSLKCYTVCFSFFKNKKRSGINPPVAFVHDFWRKVFFTLYTINWPNFIDWLHVLFEILGIMCIKIICLPVCIVMNFEINFFFVSQVKNLIIFRTKGSLKIK